MWVFGNIFGVSTVLDVFENFGEGVEPLFCEKSYFSDESGDAACCEGAPGEAEEEDFIAGVVVVG